MKSFLHLALTAALLTSCLPYLYTPRDTRSITTRSGGKTRDYLLHVPPSLAPGKPAPLVIALHGFAEWPAHLVWLSRWNRLADEQGVIVAYPSGTQLPKRWTLGGETGLKFDERPDVAFLRRMIAEIEREYRIDASRIYVNGLSNGAGMTYILACELAGQIAAVGMVSGGYLEPTGGCKPSRPMPVIVFHGTGDDVVPYGGGKLAVSPVPFPPVSDWVAAWSARNGCAPAAVTSSVSANVKLARYPGCAGGSDVLFYTIDGGGHTWPGGEEMGFGGTTTQEIDATRLMWSFFAAHPRPPIPAISH